MRETSKIKTPQKKTNNRKIENQITRAWNKIKNYQTIGIIMKLYIKKKNYRSAIKSINEEKKTWMFNYEKQNQKSNYNRKISEI